jgi:carboxyl-terminal processing protease
MAAKAMRLTTALLAVILAAAGLLAAGFVAGMRYEAGQRVLATGAVPLPELAPQVLAGTATPEERAATPEELAATFAPFWQAWDLVHEEYVDQPVDDQLLLQGALRGMVEALGDRHSAYLTQEENQLLLSDLSGRLEGIGAEVDTSGEHVKIISPMPGSPAEAAGLLPGDVILQVDGEDMLGLSGTEVILKVRGPAGTTVRLTIGREGQPEPLEFEVVRARIEIPSVEGEMLDGGIAYVRINTFGDDTTRDLQRTLGRLEFETPAGLVLDLRGNPGGYLEVAIDVVSQFIPDGLVMLERFGDGRERQYTARPNGLATDWPLVVLINEGSASASEIVAGAIQDRGRGTLVGETSYGKGTVQVSTLLRDDGGVLKLTVARWLTPDGRTIQDQGLDPDVEIILTDDDRAAGLDPQLDAALRLLRDNAALGWAHSRQ